MRQEWPEWMPRLGSSDAPISPCRSKYATGEYARMAQVLGAHAEHITDPAEVGPAIERAKEIATTGQPCVLKIITREEPVFSQYYR